LQALQLQRTQLVLAGALDRLELAGKRLDASLRELRELLA